LTSLALAATMSLTGCAGDGGDGGESGKACGADRKRTDRLTIQTAVDALREGSAEPLTQHVSLEVSAPGQPAVKMEGVGDSSPEELVAMELTLSGTSEIDMTMIYVDDKFYISGPGLTEVGKFVTVDPKDPKDPLGQALAPSIAGAGLGGTFDAWEAGLQDVRFVAVEYLDDGTEAERYTFTVDADAAFTAENPGEVAPAGLPEEISYDVWIDERNLVHRVESNLAGTRSVVNMTDYCEPIDIKAPDAEDITPRDVR
jgi:hypothetical protein